MLLQFILVEYASKHPGSVKRESEVIVSDAPPAVPHGTRSAPQSDFGKLIIEGGVGENTSSSYVNSALLAYTGNVRSLSCLYLV
jgi:hypothetical protein